MSLELLAQLTVSGLVVGSTYALLGVSFGVIYQTTKIFHLAHAVPYAAAAYGTVWAAEQFNLPLLLACLVGLIIAVLLGLAIEILAYSPMRKKGATLLALFLVSLGITVAFPNLLQIVFGPDNKSLPGLAVVTYELGSVTVTQHDLISIAVSLVFIGAGILFIDRTRFGRAVTAMRTNPMMAAAVGIDGRVVYLVVFAMGSLLAGVASLLFVTDGVATPTMGFAPVLTGFIAAFLGGIGSLWGAALGGVLLGLASSWSALFLPINYGPVVVFGAMFIVLLIRPHGLLGKEEV